MAQMAQREPSETVGDILKRLRLAAGLTQEVLAERSQVSTRTIGSIERGELQKPRSESLRLLAKALDLSPQQYEAIVATIRTQGSGGPSPDVTPTMPTRATGGDSASTYQMLPIPPTPLVGREREMTLALNALCRSEVRLLTLYGPPGVGKTRLALQIAHDMRGEFADGAVFVALAPFRQPDQVMAALAQAVGLHEDGVHSLDAALHTCLASKQLLLVLDNFEQALTASPRIAQLLGMCPTVKALVTSREVLRVRGEHELSVPPLALADVTQFPPVHDLGRYAAVDLFVQRAHAVKPAFALTESNARVVAEICARLDGLPLAIELAAARIKLLSPHTLLARLDHPLQLLTHDMRDAPERHHTLQRAVAWSHDLLSTEEQRLFAQLAVFSGGWTLEATEAVCAGSGKHESATLEQLTSLVDKSLIQQVETTTGESRFGMLETIREYALEQLAAHNDIDTLRRKHAEYYVRWAEGAEPHCTGPEQAEWFARTAAEQGNLRAALQWAVEQATVRHDEASQHDTPGGERSTEASEALRLGLRLAGALGIYWSIRGPLSEGRAWLEELLSLSSTHTRGVSSLTDDSERQAATVRAKALRMAAQLAEHEYNFTLASARLKECLRLYQQLGDREGEAAALNRLGIATLDAGNYTQAAEWFERCCALRKETGDTVGMAGALTNMGVVALQLGAYEQAASRLEAALTCYRDAGYISASGQVEQPTVNVANTFANLGVVTYYIGNYDRAIQLIEQSLAYFQQLGFGAGVAIAFHFLGNIWRERNDLKRAASLYTQSLDLFQTNPHPQGIVQCLDELARWASLNGQIEHAAHLWGAVEALRGSIPGLLGMPGLRARHERDVAGLRILLGRDAFEAAWAAGRALSLEQAVAYARTIATLPTTTATLRGEKLHVAG